MTLPPRPSIPREEYPQRRAAVRLAAQEAGLDGIVAWSMGGSTLDRYSSVFYLTNHYDAGNVFPGRPPPVHRLRHGGPGHARRWRIDPRGQPA